MCLYAVLLVYSLYIYIYILSHCRISPCSFFALTSQECHRTQQRLCTHKKIIVTVTQICKSWLLLCFCLYVRWLFWIAFCTLKLQFTLSCCRFSITISYEGFVTCKCIQIKLTTVLEFRSCGQQYFVRVSFSLKKNSLPTYTQVLNEICFCCRPLARSVSQETCCLTKCLPFPSF